MGRGGCGGGGAGRGIRGGGRWVRCGAVGKRGESLGGVRSCLLFFFCGSTTCCTQPDLLIPHPIPISSQYTLSHLFPLSFNPPPLYSSRHHHLLIPLYQSTRLTHPPLRSSATSTPSPSRTWSAYPRPTRKIGSGEISRSGIMFIFSFPLSI